MDEHSSPDQPGPSAVSAPEASQPSDPQGPDYGSPEYRSYKRAVEEGSVSFHQVASAWFDWHWGPDECPRCDGTGSLPAVTPAATPADGRTAAPTNGGQESSNDPEPAAATTASSTTVTARVSLAAAMEGDGSTTRCPECRGRGRVHKNAGRADAYEEVFHELLEIFGKQRGGVITAYFCENIRVAAALTDIWSAADRPDGPIRTIEELKQERKDREERTRAERILDRLHELVRQKASSTAIHIEPTFGDPDSPRAKQILFRCLKVHYQALEYLKPKPRKVCMRMTFNVITMLLGTLDNRVGRGEKATRFDQSHADQRTLEQELESTEGYYLTAARRSARMHYLLGMVIGLPLAGATAYALYTVPDEAINLSIAFAAGSAGALVSVLERLTTGKLEMNHEAGKATNIALGLVRPFIGALFALAVYVFISGGLVSVFEIPADPQDQRYFFAGLAFLAGFSERFAQDMVAQGRAAGGGRVAASELPPIPR